MERKFEASHMAFWESGPTFGFCHHKIDEELRKDDHLAKVFFARRFQEQEMVDFSRFVEIEASMNKCNSKKPDKLSATLLHYKVCVAFVSIFHDLTLVVAIF